MRGQGLSKGFGKGLDVHVGGQKQSDVVSNGEGLGENGVKRGLHVLRSNRGQLEVLRSSPRRRHVNHIDLSLLELQVHETQVGGSDVLSFIDSCVALEQFYFLWIQVIRDDFLAAQSQLD